MAPPILDSYVTRIAEAPDGSIWLLQTRGLFRFRRNDRHFEAVDVGHNGLWHNLMQDSDGSLWLGGEKVLAHRFQDGRIDWLGEANGIPVNSYHYFRVSTMLRDREHRLWIATWQGLCLMLAHPQPGRRAVEHVYTTRDGLPSNVVFDVFQAHDGKLWTAGENGLSEWISSGGAWGCFRRYPARRISYRYQNDVPSGTDLAEDSSGNLYISDVEQQRIRKVSTSGIISTFAGTGIAGFGGDGGPASAAMLSFLDRHPAPTVALPEGDGEAAGISYRIRGAGPPLALMPLDLAPSQWEPLISTLGARCCTITLGGPLLGVVGTLEARGRSTYLGLVRTVLDLVQIRPDEVILEVGGGSGVVLREIARRAAGANPIIDIDINPYLLREAAALAQRAASLRR